MATKLKDHETVEDILDRIETTSLHAAMASAFAEIEAATKSATNPHFKSKYADLAAIIDAIKPPLIKYGLFFTQRPQPSEDGVIVETVLHHTSGESLSLGSLYVPANKRDPQGFGSAMTYARRYALQTAFGVPTEDDDGNAASRTTDRPTTGETPPRKRVEFKSLDGKNPPPYTCPTQLMTAARQFVRTLESMGDLAEFIAWKDTPDVQDFVAQCKRDLPSWYFGGDDCPEEWVPLQVQIKRKRTELDELEEIKGRENA